MTEALQRAFELAQQQPEEEQDVIKISCTRNC